MGDVMVVNVVTTLFLLSLISNAQFKNIIGSHPIVVPDDHPSATTTSDGSFKYNLSVTLPDVISVTQYYVRIQPYYPAPEIKYRPDKNMTFDGRIAMSIVVKKPTSVFTLNVHNLNIISLKLTDILQRPVAVAGARMDEKTHQFFINFADQKQAGTVLILAMEYTGRINNYFDGGLYYSYYMDLNGGLHWMVSTQLAAFAARSVFPCLDEPSYKAIFSIELVYPSSHVPLANMMEEKTIELKNGWSRVIFKPTPLMSTYLVAFTIGPYVSSKITNQDGTLVRAWGWKGQEEFLNFAAETAGECLYQMGLYTEIKFPLEKCDHLGQPQFAAGAMENFGLVMYKYQFVAYNPNTMTTIDKVEAARVICHEVSHQWFGDLVSPKYWDDLFLNEGFATYFMRIAMAKAFPAEASFVDAEVLRVDREKALKLDGSASTHPLITLEGPFFDGITYQKGAMLLRLISDVMGADVFRNGLQQYLNSYKPLEKITSPTSYPIINVNMDKNTFVMTQEPFNEISTKLPAKWNYTWIIPLRVAQNSKVDDRIYWMVPEEMKDPLEKKLKSENTWTIVSYTSATYGRIFYDDDSLNSLLKKMNETDIPVGVKITLLEDEIALIERQKSANQSYTFNRLLNTLVSVFNTTSNDDLTFALTDIALPQLEFFASLLRDSIDAPLINKLFEKIFEHIYKHGLWEESTSWDTSALKNIFLPYAVKYNIGDASEKALNIFHDIVRNCEGSVNGSSWCTGFSTDIHRAVYCAAAKYDNDEGGNFGKLKQFYSGEVKVNPYFYQEYRALLEGMTCTERKDRLDDIIEHFLESPLQPAIIFGWLKTNPKASDALYNFLNKNSNEVLRYKNLSAYLGAMIYNWRSKNRLDQFSRLYERLSPALNEAQKAVFKKHEKILRANIEWSRKNLPLVMRWMYNNLVVIGKDRWDGRLPGTVNPKRYNVHIIPYIPGSGKYDFHRNLTFDSTVEMIFTVTQNTSELILNAHRLLIYPDTLQIFANVFGKKQISTSNIVKDYENGMIKISLMETLIPGIEYSLSVSYTGFIFGAPHEGVLSNYNFYEFNDKKGWIFTTDFETGPGVRSLMVCCDEPSYKAVFNISVKHAADMVALSNTMNTGTVVLKDGWAVTTFQKTPEMSSYLVAICVGHFGSLSTVSKSGVLVRVFSWTGMERYADFSVKFMAGAVDFMSEYFDHKFPLSKLDMVALPQHSEPSAMENWGLILGNYHLLMVDVDYADVNTLFTVANTVAHEVVHQWFGDLVTMKWWTESFLSEGFAQYFSANAVNYTVPEQQDYVINFTRFKTMIDAMLDDCDEESSVSVISEEGEILSPTVYLKGSTLLNTLWNVLSPKTLQKGLRKYISRNAYGNADVSQLWAALTEACEEDGVKGWDGKPLDVATFMKSWITEKSFPILKVTAEENGRISYIQESCLKENTTWYIPVFSTNKTNEDFNWFYGKNGTSPAWSPSQPLTRIDNVRGVNLLRLYYDKMTFPSMARNIQVVKDEATQGAILKDAWFFVSKGDYTWKNFLDIVNVIEWRESPIIWYIGLEFIQDMYRSFRFHKDLPMVVDYLVSISERTYLAVGRSAKPSPNWGERSVGGVINEWMCRFNNSDCLSTANKQFIKFIRECGKSYSGTGKCVGVIPDFRRTMYCYGLKQNSKRHTTVYSLYKYFEKNLIYFDRDGERLLYALSCLNDTQLLERYLRRSLSGDLPSTLIQYIGENDVTGEFLYDFLRNNTKQVLNSNINFEDYVESMTTDWATGNQLLKLTSFTASKAYKRLNKKHQAIWHTAIQTVIEKQSSHTLKTDGIVEWLKNHFEPSSTIHPMA
ncbi:hypothetical protein RB195_021308 [Necator americanus]|uniref:Peptidase family M1 n=1 Tax=Necator americanus TaxID=51031 RepID=A0ABR1ECD8_NECAM